MFNFLERHFDGVVDVSPSELTLDVDTYSSYDAGASVQHTTLKGTDGGDTYGVFTKMSYPPPLSPLDHRIDERRFYYQDSEAVSDLIGGNYGLTRSALHASRTGAFLLKAT